LKRLQLRGEARAELLHETRYYEGLRVGSGKRFRETVNEAFHLIRRFPQGGAPGPGGTRRTKVRGFPFTVTYREEGDRLVVFAIAPDRRQAGYWMARTRGD
jgi:hypothetical protein